MSIESLCEGDTVVKQTESNTVGTAFGNTPTYADGATLDCLVQTAEAAEAMGFATRGMKYTHIAFFSTDPSLTNQNRLKWTVRGNEALAAALFLRVLAVETEGRPGESLLWFAFCSEDTSRRDE